VNYLLNKIKKKKKEQGYRIATEGAKTYSDIAKTFSWARTKTETSICKSSACFPFYCYRNSGFQLNILLR
jgi:hypothetical protein